MKEKRQVAKKDKIKFAVLVLVILAMIVVTVLLLPYFIQLKDEAFRNQIIEAIRSKGALGVLILLAAQLLQVVIAVIPGEMIEIIAGILYGAWGGYFICTVGTVLSSMMIFALVRKLGSGFVQSVVSEEKMKRMKFLHDAKKLDTIIFILFFVPGTPKDLLTYFVPLTKMKMSRFLILSNIARIPSVISSTYLGNSLGEGNWIKAVVIFAVTGIVGLLGILLNDKIVALLHRNSRKEHQDHETKES